MAVSAVQDQDERLMSRRTRDGRLGSRGRPAGFAKATEVYAESLEDRDLANIYWGKWLGLWRAVTILSAANDSSTRPVVFSTALSLQGWRPDGS